MHQAFCSSDHQIPVIPFRNVLRVFGEFQQRLRTPGASFCQENRRTPAAMGYTCNRCFNRFQAPVAGIRLLGQRIVCVVESPADWLEIRARFIFLMSLRHVQIMLHNQMAFLATLNAEQHPQMFRLLVQSSCIKGPCFSLKF